MYMRQEENGEDGSPALMIALTHRYYDSETT